MNDSRLRKAKLNLIWLIVFEIVTFVCNLILPRLIILNYGSSYNGLISSITQFLNFVSILRLGVSGATRVALYNSLNENNIDQTSAILKATENHMRKIGYVIIFIIVVLSFFYPIFVTQEFGFINTVIIVIAVGLGTFSQYFFGITYRTLLQADQKLYIYNIVQIVATCVNALISVVLMKIGLSLQIVKLFSAVIFTIAPLFLNRYVIWIYKIKTHIKPDNLALSRKKDVMGQSVANIVHENTDVIVLTFFCDMKIVSVYTMYNLVVSGIKQVMNIFTVGMESVFGNMWAKKEKDNLNKNFLCFEYLISLVITILFSCTFSLILPFISLYTKGVSDVNYIIPQYAVMTILSLAIYCFRIPYMTLVQAAGHYKETKKAAYFEAILNLGISVSFVCFLGITGVALGTLIANIFRTIHYIIYVSKYLIIRKLNVSIKRVIWIGANIVLSVAFNSCLLESFKIINWYQWLIGAVCCAFLDITISIISSLIFYKNDFRGIMAIGQKMLKAK